MSASSARNGASAPATAGPSSLRAWKTSSQAHRSSRGCGAAAMTCSSSATNTRPCPHGGAHGRNWAAMWPASSTRPTSGTRPALSTGEETALPAGAGDGLIWLGRIDEEKAPHIAILAARIAGRRIRIVGPVFDAAYVECHGTLFRAGHVELAGELGGTRISACRDAGRRAGLAGRHVR